MAIKRWNANTSTWDLVGTPGTVTPAAIGAAALSGDNTFTGKINVAGVNSTPQSGYNPDSTAGAWTKAALSTSGSWGGSLSMLDGSAGWNLRAQDNGGTFRIGYGTTTSTITDVISLTNAGNVGVGTAYPATFFLDSSGNNVTAKLIDVQPGNNTYGGIVVGTARTYANNTTYRQGYFVRRADGWNTSRVGMWKGSDALSGNLEYWERLIFNNDGGDASIVFATNLNERMRITSDGNVGIGTTSPQTLLHTYTASGGNKLTVEAGAASQQAVLQLMTNATTPGQCQIYMGKSGAATNGQVGYDPNSNFLYFYTSNTEKSRIDTNGYHLLGYTSSNGAYRLQVNSQIFATSSSIATSDGRYKENVLPITSGLDIIDSLNPVSFDWKEHPVHNFVPGKTVGFIAQEVKEALKDYDWVDNIIKTNYNEELDEEFLGIAESNIIPLLVAAVKELRSELNTLKSSML